MTWPITINRVRQQKALMWDKPFVHSRPARTRRITFRRTGRTGTPVSSTTVAMCSASARSRGEQLASFPLDADLPVRHADIAADQHDLNEGNRNIADVRGRQSGGPM